jgi:hypothetical protein
MNDEEYTHIGDADAYADHEYCTVCRECITCGLRSCRDGKPHTRAGEEGLTDDQRRLKAAYSDALDRVLEVENERDVAAFTQEHKDVSEVETYLAENRDNLVPEEIHFLEVTIALRRAFSGPTSR